MNRRIEPTFGTGNGPPPLPPTPAPRPSGPPPRRGMHGCLIALIVCAALALPLGGILAAIAIPAYQDYVARAKVVQALAFGEALTSAVDDGFARDGHCPRPAPADPGARGPATAADIAAAMTGEIAPGR
jgi:type IV pilus assembly protein PilA